MDTEPGTVTVDAAWLEAIADEMRSAEKAIEASTAQLAEIHDKLQSRLLDLLHHAFNAKAEGKKSYAAGLLMGYLIMTGEKQVG